MNFKLTTGCFGCGATDGSNDGSTLVVFVSFLSSALTDVTLFFVSGGAGDVMVWVRTWFVGESDE